MPHAAQAARPPLNTVPDSDHDGYPDVLELVGADRTSFADWFAAVAESQYGGMNADWKPQDRDCSGLLRYAFINALMPHDAAWYAKFRTTPTPHTPPVRAYSYPVPLLSRSVFRVAGGDYRPERRAAGPDGGPHHRPVPDSAFGGLRVTRPGAGRGAATC